MINKDTTKSDSFYEKLKEQFFIIAGPCVIENFDVCATVCETIKKLSIKHNFEYIFKSSFDKANRLSYNSYRGPGIEKGVQVLEKIRREFDVPVLTDIHEPGQIFFVEKVVDILQIPAFLCRQTDLVIESAKTQKIINIKKGQFMAPDDMKYIVEKAKSVNNNKIILTERGFSFGYHNLVVDFRSILIMKEFCDVVVYDATHSVQYPGGGGGKSGGARFATEPLMYAAIPVGVNGIFMEVHPDPPSALSDGATQIKLYDCPRIFYNLSLLREAYKKVEYKKEKNE